MTAVAVDLYDAGLRRRAPVWWEAEDGTVRELAVERWRQPLLPGDAGLLDRAARCGPALDVGCGPGRLAAALGARGVPVLGIDISPAAVALTRQAGANALRRDVFARVPGSGRWPTVLLADGNLGIGGDPTALLARIAALLAPDGAALVEVDPPGSVSRRLRVRLRTASAVSDWFRWATVGCDDLAAVAAPAGMVVSESWTDASRWFATLARRPPGAARPTRRLAGGGAR